ncbi:phage baseplate plug family protein [Acetobacter lambici]|uniref:Cyanophage baseplate Pam3 plug gp18 domain-containing protein n=1 Tax=Acetobacter lambici TaxID=1332824 RepID=A0ABT1EY72_9PROT|nr:hypothetical protein [Acetobacter lambici]MCP1257899.1 hypothetical protein [Acetobacter lambici]
MCAIAPAPCPETLPGDLAFADTQGTQDPDYTGLGSRFVLVYAEDANG